MFSENDSPARLPLPMRTRITLWFLLGLSLCVLALLWEHYSRQAAAPRAAAAAVAPRAKVEINSAPAPESIIARADLKEPQRPEVIGALAEIELLDALARTDPRFSTALAAARLKPYASSEIESVRTAASSALAPMLADLDVQARAAEEAAAELSAISAQRKQQQELVLAEAALKARLEEEARTAHRDKQKRAAMLRAAWLDLFSKFSAALADGKLEQAEQIAQPAPDSLLFEGGPSSPEKVLQGCLADVKAIRELHDTVLNSARREKRAVALTLRRGRVDGILDGVDGRQIQVALAGGARVSVKIEALATVGLMNFFEMKDLGTDESSLAIGILKAHENPSQAHGFLPRVFAAARQPLPEHWEYHLKLVRFKRLDKEIGVVLHDLAATLETGDAEKIKAALESARPLVRAFEEYEPLSEARQKSIAAAERIAGKAARERIVLQNGSSPDADYAGVSTDQISQYKASADKTDAGVQYGLKAGASGGVQRILIRFDGLEAALGKTRLKRATLELYQIECPQSAGAVVALFRLKQPWVPSAGTWMNFSAEPKSAWALPGASGDADVESSDEAKLTIDKQKNIWRSFDVTAYAQDVLSGKTPNRGLLLRVINGEGSHQVRFYPETDMDAIKDKKLRPRLVLDVENEN